MTTARRKMIDRDRHSAVHDSYVVSALAETSRLGIPAWEHPADTAHSAWSDPRLRLLFVCAHPALDPAIRTPLMLQAVLGFDAQRIASAFLVSPTTISQRLVRAKRKIRDARIPFDIPPVEGLAQRVDAVLGAVYAAYTEGWTDPLDGVCRDFAEEAIWLGRTLIELCPGNAEVRGLLALMLYLESRRAARRTETGAFVPLSEQQTSLWNGALIKEAESLLASAALYGSIGRFQLEAAIQSAHAARANTGATDWAAIVQLYDALYLLVPSPVVATNRAIALAETNGPTEGLRALAMVADDPRVRLYQPYWAALAHLQIRVGKLSEAVSAYDEAIGLSKDPAVRCYLAGRRDHLTEAKATR